MNPKLLAPILAAGAILVPAAWYTFRRHTPDVKAVLHRTGVRFTSEEEREELTFKLQQAGLYHVRPEWFAGLRIVLGGGTGLLGLMLLPFGLDLFFVVLLAPLLYFAPMWWLNRKIRKRRYEAKVSLSDFSMLFSVALDAGADVRTAIREAARIVGGPIKEEVDRALAEEATGLTLVDALLRMTDRLDVEELRVLVRAVVQSYRYGSPLADVMREAADRLRSTRRFEIMEAAGRLQVVLIFPVLFFILIPSVFVVMYPAFVRLLEVL